MQIEYTYKIDKTHVYSGEIDIIHMSSYPYECEVNTDGSRFHVIFGNHAYGNYLCIPNIDIGTEMAHLSDTFWNSERLRHIGMSRKTAVGIAYALKALSEHIS